MSKKKILIKTTKHIARKSVGGITKVSSVSLRHGKKIAKIGAKSTVRTVRVIHHNVAVKPHNYMNDNWMWYARWHAWKWHKLVHGVTLSAYILIAGILVINSSNIPSAALNTWTQSNWAGGSGTNTSNQYESVSNIDATTANQLTLSKSSNSFSNSTFDSDLTGWNGYNKAYDNTQSYSASGSAKVTAGVVSASVLNTQLTTTGVASQYNVNSGDINNDGIEDIVIPTQSGSFSEFRIYNGLGDGTYASATVVSTAATSTTASDTVIHDFNGDGWNDILLTYASSAGKVSYFQNNGSGGFTTSVDYSGLPTGGNRACLPEKGFIDDNNSMDFVVFCNTGTVAYVFNNSGTGTFTLNTYALSFTSLNPQNFTLVDINGDNRLDIVAGPPTTCTIFVLPNNGGGFDAAISHTFTQCGTASIAKYAITGGDVNNDGYGDVAIGRRSGTGGTSTSDTYYVTVLFGNSSSGFSSQADYSSSSGSDDQYAQIVMHDFNSDGFRDIAIGLYSNSVLGYYANNGNGTFATKVDYTSGTNPSGITLADSNADGVKDIVTANLNSSNFSVFINRTPGDTMTQAINVGDTEGYQLEAYVYTTGSAVTSADAELWYNGATISTTFTASATPGWYKLSGTLTGANARRSFGVVAKQGKTIYVDNVSLYKYSSSGYIRSAIFDPGYGGDWAVLSYSTTNTSGVAVKVRTSDNSSMTGATAFSGCTAISSGSDMSSNGCVTDGDQYVQYEINLSAVSGDTPVFSSINLNYSAYDIIPPDTNASNIVMEKVNGGDSIAENEWTNGASPYFTWTDGDDNSGGTGLLGYCVYLGTDNSADPITTKGILGTSPITNAACPFIVGSNSLDLATAGLLSTALTTSNSAYYINIRAVDIVGNVYTGSPAQFHFRFDNTLPSNPAYLSAPSQFLNTKTATITWPSSGDGVASDANSGLLGLQYKINSSPWYGDNHTGDGDINDLLANDGSYTTISSPDFSYINDGINTIYFRTWDNAGNVSTSYVTAALKVNTNGSPTEPQNLTATPSTNTANSFAFSWNAPATFVGSASSLTYCYTINTLPNVSNCNFTSAGTTTLSAGAYATQPGANIFYLVAKDESGNINYSSFTSTTFTANTPAPGIPSNVDIVDVSIKATSNWRLAVTWDEPDQVGAGISSYKLYRSTDNSSFSQVGTSSSTSFVDASLNQQTYYYKVKACDSANNCSADSSVVSKLPTGKFTSPATITSEPEVSNITTKKAKITWSTDRVSDSKISIGTASGSYSPSEIGNSSQVTAHSIELDNLAAGTTYYFKAKWTDTDGNTGVSQEYSFTTAPAPLLKEVNIASLNLTGVTIRFTIKDAVKVDLQYGKSDSFGGSKSINTSMSESTYEIALEGLDDGVKYLYKLQMQDSEGGKYQSSIFSFVTPPRPKILNLRFQPVEGEPTSTQRVTWESNIPTSSQVSYGKVGSDGTALQSNELKTSHEILIRGLEDSSEYFLIAQGRDSNGNIAVSDRQVFKTALDTRSPSISDIIIEPSIRGTGGEARGQIIVSWKTDEPSTSQVAYAEGSAAINFNNKTAEDGQLTTDHIVIISDLPTSKVYSIMPISKDKAGNPSTTKSQAAIIGRASDSVLNIVLLTLRKVFGL